MHLPDLQQQFLRFLLQDDPDFERHIAGAKRRQRLQIYAEGYVLRLMEALADSFPNLRRWIGEERFETIAREYIGKFPSHHFSVRYFGHQLSDFLSIHPLYGKHGELAELAHFEWCLRDVFDTADAPALQLGKLGQLAPEDWPDLVLQFHPSVRHTLYRYNTPTVWNGLTAEQDPVSQLENEPVQWLIWRHDLKTLFRSLNQAETLSFDQINCGRSFAQWCERLAQDFPDNAAYLAAAFVRKGVEEGLFSDTVLCQSN